MTEVEVTSKVDQIIDQVLDVNDERLAVAEQEFFQAAGLTGNDDALNWAFADLVDAFSKTYAMAATVAFWAGG